VAVFPWVLTLPVLLVYQTVQLDLLATVGKSNLDREIHFIKKSFDAFHEGELLGDDYFELIRESRNLLGQTGVMYTWINVTKLTSLEEFLSNNFSFYWLKPALHYENETRSKYVIYYRGCPTSPTRDVIKTIGSSCIAKEKL
jgi:hypothetical protein